MPEWSERLLQSIAGALPKLRGRFAVGGILIAVAGSVATRFAAPEAIHAQVSAGAVGVAFLVFGLLFPALASFPEADRARLVLRLFSVFVVLILALVALTGYFLVSAQPEFVTYQIPLSTPPDARSTLQPPDVQTSRDRLPADSLSALALMANEGRITLTFGAMGSREGYPAASNGLSDWITQDEATDSTWIEFQSGGFVWRTIDSLGQFALVTHGSGRFVAERVYLKLQGYAECSLRDESFAPQAPVATPAYSFFVTSGHQVYPIVDRSVAGRTATWRLEGNDSDEFSFRLRYPPYVLYVVTLLADVRNLESGARFRVRSHYLPLIRVENGNSGGCLDLTTWYRRELLQAPPPKSYWSEDMDVLTYQLLTTDAALDRRFYLDLVKPLDPSELSKVRGDMARHVSNATPNPVFAENLGYFDALVRWKLGGGVGDPP